VICLLKARTVEEEKLPLLANGLETTFVVYNDGETDKGTTSVGRQQIHNKQTQTAAAR
jgi:hypothetical protein